MPFNASNTAECTMAATRPAFSAEAPPTSDTRNASSFQSVTSSARAGAAQLKNPQTTRTQSALLLLILMVPPALGNGITSIDTSRIEASSGAADASAAARCQVRAVALTDPFVNGGVNAKGKGTTHQKVRSRWRRMVLSKGK